jgi:hypothetical protein
MNNSITDKDCRQQLHEDKAELGMDPIADESKRYSPCVASVMLQPTATARKS